MAKKFTWDEGVLSPDTVVVPFLRPADEPGGEPIPENVTFYEFSRTDLIEYLESSKKLKIYKELKETEEVEDEDNPGKMVERPKRERLSLGKIGEEHAAFMFKWLEKLCRGSHKADWFANLNLTASMLGKLAEMMYNINHIEEVVAASGNWLMLPTVQKMLAEIEEKEPESEDLQPISEA